MRLKGLSFSILEWYKIGPSFSTSSRSPCKFLKADGARSAMSSTKKTTRTEAPARMLNSMLDHGFLMVLANALANSAETDS